MMLIAKLGTSSNGDMSREQGQRMCMVDRDIESDKSTNQRQDEECMNEIPTSIISNFYATS